MATYDDGDFLTTTQAAAYLQRSERWLSRHSYHTGEDYLKRNSGRVKPLIYRHKLGRENRFKFGDLKSLLGIEE